MEENGLVNAMVLSISAYSVSVVRLVLDDIKKKKALTKAAFFFS